MCGLLRYMKSNISACHKFLDKKDCKFTQLRNTQDSLFSKLHSERIGQQTKMAEVLSRDDEKKLWESGTLNTTTPKGLLNTAFYIVGKMLKNP